MTILADLARVAYWWCRVEWRRRRAGRPVEPAAVSTRYRLVLWTSEPFAGRLRVVWRIVASRADLAGQPDRVLLDAIRDADRMRPRPDCITVFAYTDPAPMDLGYTPYRAEFCRDEFDWSGRTKHRPTVMIDTPAGRTAIVWSESEMVDKHNKPG